MAMLVLIAVMVVMLVTMIMHSVSVKGNEPRLVMPVRLV